jgi:hypothetical protein
MPRARIARQAAGTELRSLEIMSERIFRISLRVVFYKRGRLWIAHCLEFDLCGDGSTRQAALASLSTAIGLQIEHSMAHDNWNNLFTPAPSEIQAMFFSGKPTDQAEMQLKIEQTDNVAFEEQQYREFSGIATI